MKKKTAIMLADTRPALLGQMLVQIQETSAGVFDEAIIFDTNIPEHDKEVMGQIMPCRFIPYVSPLSELLLNKPRFQRFSLIMFARYEMFRLLDEYSKIVWIDTDMLIQRSLSALIEDTEGCEFAILCEDPENKSAKNVDYMRTNFFDNLPGYRMDTYLYCTGTIVASDILKRKCDYTQWCYDKTVEWADNLNLPDQGVINAWIQEFGINVKALGQNGKYGCFPYVGRDCSDAVLVHSWGGDKFWSNYYLSSKFPRWKECYDKWLAMGGSEFAHNPKPEVSVIIPVYKPDLGYFRQCLDSLMTQEKNDYDQYTNFEVIIVSEPFEQDAIRRFVDSYQDARIQVYFSEERLGIAASLNKAMRLAQGEFIARIDDDDIAAPRRFIKQVEYLRSNPDVTLCTTDYFYFGDMNDGRVALEGEMSRAWSILTCPFDHPTIMFRRKFFVDNNLFYDEKRGYVEDWELWQRAFKKGMVVGGINEILFYHRWHNGSAGQTNKTVDMMREMIQVNFRELGVDVPTEDLWMLSPYNGKVQDAGDYKKLEQYFNAALENNAKLKLYDPMCIARAFCMRLSEARTGVLNDLMIYRTVPSDNAEQEKFPDVVLNQDQETVKPRTSWIRRILKKLLKPLYQPFRWRYEDRLVELQCRTASIESNSRHTINLLNQMISTQEKRIEEMSQQINAMNAGLVSLIEMLRVHETDLAIHQKTVICTEAEKICQALSEKVYDQAENIQLLLSEKMYEQAENTRQTLSEKVYEQAENTRQTLSEKVYEQAENARQTLSEKVYEQAENTRQSLSEKVYEQAENTRQTLSEKVYEQAENTRQSLSEKVYEQAENTRQTLSEKVYEQAENTRQTLSAKVYEQTENTRQTMNGRIWTVEQTMQKRFDSIKNAAASDLYQKNRIPYVAGEKIRIVFLYQVASFWPSWEALYKKLAADDRFDVKFLFLDETVMEKSQMVTAEAFIKEKEIPYIPYGEFDLDGFAPHIIVVQTPYDEWHRKESHHAFVYKSKGYRIVYIPYGIEITDTETSRQDQFETMVERCAWRIYTFSKEMLADYQKHCENASAVRGLGIPRFDGLWNREEFHLSEELQKKIGNRKVVLWKVHFPKTVFEDGKEIFITPDLDEYVKFSEIIRNYPEFFFIFLPHPKFKDAKDNPEIETQVKKLFENLGNADNVWIDFADDYRNSLVNADYIIIDRSAVMVEAGLLQVPVLYMQNPTYQEKLTGAIEPLVSSYYQGSRAEDMADFLAMCKAGKDPQKEIRMARAKECLYTFDGHCTERIVDDMIRGLESESV